MLFLLMVLQPVLNFTPLEFETLDKGYIVDFDFGLNFTPLEFETPSFPDNSLGFDVKFYSVGV